MPQSGIVQALYTTLAGTCFLLMYFILGGYVKCNFFGRGGLDKGKKALIELLRVFGYVGPYRKLLGTHRNIRSAVEMLVLPQERT